MANKPHCSIITANRKYLVENIDLMGTSILDHLVQLQVLGQNQLQNIKDRYSTNQLWMSALLDHLYRRPYSDWEKFLQCLEDNNHGHIVGNLQGLQIGERIPMRLQRDVANAILRNFNHTEIWDWEDEIVFIELDRLYTDLVYAKRKHTTLKPEEYHLNVYTDMFLQDDSEVFPCRIYIEGAAGTGKTTLAKRLLVDWARYVLAGWWRRIFRIPGHIKSRLGQFDFVLPVFLRNVTEGQSLAKALIQNLDMDSEEGNLTDIIESNQTKILIVFEGLDEYRDETAPDITAVLKRGKWKQANLLITSRNKPNLHFHKEQEFPTTHIILKGFSEKGVKTYTNRFFRGTPYARALKQAIDKSEDRTELSRYPAVLLLMCVLWRDNNAIGDSVTEFYFDFLKYICSRYERKFLKEQDRASSEEIVKKYHKYLMEIGEVATDGLRGDTLELSFEHSVLTSLSEVTKKLGLFNTNYREAYKQKKHKSVSFQHKTFQEFMAAYYIVHCEPEKRHELLIHFVSSPNAIKEATMLVTFLQGLGNEMITNLVRDIIEGSESDVAKTNTAVQLAFLLDAKDGSFALPEVIELELSQHYTDDVLGRYFSMDCSAVSQIVMWVPSITNIKYLQLMRNGCLKKVILKKLDTKFVDNFDIKMANQSAQPLRIKTLIFDGLWKMSSQDITFMCSTILGKFQIIFTCNHFQITLVRDQECRKGDFGIFVERILIQDDSFQVGLFDSWFQSDVIASARCAYAEHEVYMDLVHRLGQISSLTDISLQNCPDISGVPSVLSNNVKLQILHLAESHGSRYDFTGIGTQIEHLSQLKELRLCKATAQIGDPKKNKASIASCGKPPRTETTEHILSPIIANLTEATQLEVIDLTDNVTEGHLYRVLGDILPHLKYLRELRLGVCDQPHAMMYVCKGLRHTAHLEILDMLRNTFTPDTYQELARNIFSALKVLKLGKSGTPDACTPLLDNLRTSNISGATQLEVIDFTENVTEGDLYKVLGDILPQLKNLRELRLGTCDQQEAIMYVCRGLKQTTRLEILDMLRNTFSCDAYQELGRNIFSALKVLKLGKCGTPDACRPLLNNMLTSTLSGATQLEVLDFSENMTEGDLYKVLGDILPRLKNLRELRLATCDQPEAIMYICRGLKHTTGLEILDMLRNTFNPEAYQELSKNMFPAIKFLKLGKSVSLDACKTFLANIPKSSAITVLDLSRVLVSGEVCKHTAELVNTLVNLRELYLCKCETINAMQHFIQNLKHTREIEILDISGNISNPEPYEVLDVRGRTTGNKVTSDVYQTLSDRMTGLTKLRELRLCECDEPLGLIPVVRSLHHVTQLQALDLSGNTADREVFEILGEQLKHLEKLTVLRLCVSDQMNAVLHIVDKLYLVPDINVLDISGLKGKFAKRTPFEESYSTSNRVDKTVYQVLGDQLQHVTDLRELRLCNCNDVDAVKPVVTGLGHTKKLHTLDLLGNEVKYDVFTEIGRLLSSLGELRELRLCYCRDHNAAGKIVKYLVHTPGLIVLNLTGKMVTFKELEVKFLKKNTAGRGVYETLSRQLKGLPQLRELRVCDCRYAEGGEGVAVVGGLQYTPGLQVLQMGRWSLDAAGVEQLGDRLINLRDMRQLLLGECDVYNMRNIQPDTLHNYIQIHKAWERYVSQLSMLTQLQVLYLSDNNIGNYSVVQLSRQLPSLTNLDALYMFRCGLTDTQAVIQLIDALPSCPSLRTLNVSENHLGDGLEQIVNMTQQLSQLYELNLRYNKMRWYVVENIKRQLKQRLPDLELRM